MPRYTVEVRKSLGAYTWANTWHIESPSRTDADQFGVELADFERALLSNTARVDDVKVSLWPNPTGIDFTIQTLEQLGQAALTNPEPAEMTLLVSIATPIGRPGRKWLRMSLDESDVTQSSGAPILVSGGAWETRFNTARSIINTAVIDFNTNLLVGSDPLTARVSLNVVQAIGVGFRDRDVGWYNRTPTP
jgi:hypothetical protein